MVPAAITFRGRSARFAGLPLVFAAALLAACNSSDATLGITGAETGQQQAAAAPATSDIAAQTALATVHVAPIIGSTVEAVTPLSRRLGLSARAGNIRIGADNDPALTHVIKGYFSALAEPQGTTVIYVWDVFDTTGTRLHRIQGQEQQAGASNPASPWASITPEVMERIADRTVAEFIQWRSATTNGASAAPAAANG